jgi:hypothetical protein
VPATADGPPGWQEETIVKRAAITAAALAIQVCLWGCAWAKQPPVEMMANKVVDEAVVPGIREGLSRGVEHLIVQAGAQTINPRYKFKVSAKWVVGIEADVEVGVEGVSGQVQISTIAPANPPLDADGPAPAATSQASGPGP